MGGPFVACPRTIRHTRPLSHNRAFGGSTSQARTCGRGRPRPSVYVIDRRGIVRWKFTEVNYKIRPTNQMILEALQYSSP